MSKEVSNYLRKSPKEWVELCQQIRTICLEEQYELSEEWKWGPNYSNHGLVIGWAYFKKHIKITFFNGSAMRKNQKHFNHCLDNAFNRSIKIGASLSFNEEVFRSCLEESIALNKRGFKRVRQKKEIKLPETITQMLDKNEKVKRNFYNLSPTYQREYIEWIVQAKREATKIKRLKKMEEMLTQGKSLHDKYK